MKKIYIIIIVFCFSCKGKLQKEVSKIDSDDYQILQDSLREKLMASKPNKLLKSHPILQELYIRGLIEQDNDSIKFDLDFNLHGLDCGAPDCFSTIFNFTILLREEQVVFPNKIPFLMKNIGCVEQETTQNAIFELIEQTENAVNYYSEQTEGNLIIFKRDLYYFPNVKKGEIKVNLIGDLLKSYNEEETFEYPYQSILMRPDYGLFFDLNAK